MIKRKHSFDAWHMLKDLSQPEFWLAMCEMYKRKKAKELTYKIAADLMFRSHSRVQKWFTPGTAQQKLSLCDRHHLYLSIQYAPHTPGPRTKSLKRRLHDRLGNIMSSLKEQHYRVVKERLPLEYWAEFAKEKYETETQTGRRYIVLRSDKTAGFTLDNIYLHQIKTGRKLLTDLDQGP